MRFDLARDGSCNPFPSKSTKNVGERLRATSHCQRDQISLGLRRAWTTDIPCELGFGPCLRPFFVLAESSGPLQGLHKEMFSNVRILRRSMQRAAV